MVFIYFLSTDYKSALSGFFWYYINNYLKKIRAIRMALLIFKTVTIMKTLFLTCLSFFMLLSCSNSIDSFTPQTITPVLIGKSSISDPSTPLQNVLITNQTQWDALLISMNEVNNVSANFTETNIDLSNFDIIAVFRNPISNSSSTVDITSIIENRANRIVTVQNLINGISSDISQPFHIVKIPKSTKPVVFE
jgi:hypothetical protein